MAVTDPGEIPELDEGLTLDGDPRATHPAAGALEGFVEELRGLREMLPVLSSTAKDAEAQARRRKQSVLQASKPRLALEEDEMKAMEGRHRIAPSMRTALLRPRVEATGWSHAERELGGAVLLKMSAQFDRFVGEMVQAAFAIKPEMTRSLKRELSFTDLRELPDIDAVLQLVIEKEVEKILHEKRSEQIKWFVTRCKMFPLDERLEAELSDIAELRNIVAHHGGRVTSRVGFGWRNRKTPLLHSYEAGQQVTITTEDIVAIHDVLFLVAVLVAQGVWRGLRPEQRHSADEDLHDLTYSRLALDEFALTQRTLSLCAVYTGTMSQSARLVNLVNLAQTYKWLEEPTTCEELLLRENWDDHEPEFRFAVAVLREEWTEAVALMEQCVREDQVDRTEFENWPLLKDFRETDQFQNAFERAYGI